MIVDLERFLYIRQFTSYPVLLNIALKVAKSIAAGNDRQEISIDNKLNVTGTLNKRSFPPEYSFGSGRVSKRYRSEMSDVYSFGVTMYMLLYKAAPARNEHLPKVRQQMPDYVYTLIYNALSHDPTLRPRIKDIIEDLQFVISVYNKYNEVP